MSEFTSGAREKFPNLHLDYAQVNDHATWPQHALEREVEFYSEFTQRENLMPRAREASAKILGHLVFELEYRLGMHGVAHAAK